MGLQNLGSVKAHLATLAIYSWNLILTTSPHPRATPSLAPPPAHAGVARTASPPARARAARPACSTASVGTPRTACSLAPAAPPRLVPRRRRLKLVPPAPPRRSRRLLTRAPPALPLRACRPAPRAAYPAPLHGGRRGRSHPRSRSLGRSVAIWTSEQPYPCCWNTCL